MFPGIPPTNVISVEFRIRPKFGVIEFKMWPTDYNEILHMSRQLHCRDMFKILFWSVEYILNQSTGNFGWKSNLIEIRLVPQVPGHFMTLLRQLAKVAMQLLCNVKAMAM